MTDFGGFEIEDETNGASSNQSFGGFEVEADVQDNKQPLEVGGFEVDDTPAPTWEGGDGGASTLPDGQTNQWGGNLRNEGRKPLIRRDENGKVSGYSTTTSMLVQDRDGKIAVIPTVVDGKELSQEDAVRHYAETGEHWGRADDEDSARKMALAVHEEHAKSYGKGWNDYVQEHWDEMGDEIRGDPGVRGEHARRRREARIADELKAWGRDADVIKGYRERTKTTQVAPELFLVGGWLEDADGNVVKPGDAIAVSNVKGKTFTGEGGQAARLMKFTGVTDDGKPTFKEVEGVSSEGAFLTGKLHVLDSDFNQMIGKGEGKVERSPLEQVRLGAIAETGDRLRYTDDALGTAKAVFDRVVPYFGRMAPNEQRERTRHLSNIYEGKLDGYDGKTEADKYRDAARKAGLEPWNPLESLHPNESEAEFMGRIQHEAGQELKSDAIAKLDAGGKLEATEASVLDKIVKGGIESGGYALEFALPGGAIFKGARALNWGVKAVRTATALGSAVPVVATEAMSRYQENITPEYGFGQRGEFKMTAAPDSEGEAALKAIGGAVFDTAVETGLESATMGLLRLAGKPAGWALGKMTPRAVKDMGARGFNKFMASETGQALRAINRAYQDFAAKTQINSPLGELAEENVQALEKALGLEGKSSEHKGFGPELKEYWDKQINWQTQLDIFYGLIAQLALGAVKSTEAGIAEHISTSDARRDWRMALKRSAISDKTIATLTPKQQKTLDHMWRRYSANPEELKAKVKGLGLSMRLAVDELLSRDGVDMARSLEERGITPEKFTIQAGADGKPSFQSMRRFTPDGKSAPMNAMVDSAHGVTIVDRGDGTYYVMNDWRGLDAIPAYSFEEAQKKADNEVMDNQRKDADNEKKIQYLNGLAYGQYAGRKVNAVPSEAALRWQIASELQNGGTPFGITSAAQVFNEDGSLKEPGAGGFHTPDGTAVIILDNVTSPADMERVLAHEATGHEGVESKTGRGAKTVDFIRSSQAEGFNRHVAEEFARYVGKLTEIGIPESAATEIARQQMSTDAYAKEAMARYVQGRLHQPTWFERKKHEANQRRRDAGEDVPFDQADMEVMLAEAEAQGRNPMDGVKPGENVHTGGADSGVRYFEAEKGETNETGNGTDEAPAQPEQGGERPGSAEAPRPAEAGEAGSEAPREGVVEPSAQKQTSGGQNLTGEEQKKPATKRGDNLLGYSYEDYAAHPDNGGTADEMGAALLRFALDNGGILKMPKKGDADPLADWISNFLDGNARSNNRGEFIALFGMKPKTGTNDSLAEDMPSGLKEFVEKMIDEKGHGAVAKWFLETRRKYAKWAADKRNAAREGRAAAKDRKEEAKAEKYYNLDELAAAQDAMDEEFANALGVLEGADEADYAMLTPENLKIAKSGDTIRFDHDRKSFVFGSYDADNGVLVVYDEDVAEMEGGKFRRAYRVTENSIEEIENGQGNENRADANRAGNEEGAQGGDFQLESVTAEQITAEQKKRAEKEAIKKRQEAPLKGSGAVNVQPEMDLGQAGQQDLFSPIAENGGERNWDAPISDIKDAKTFLDSIGYPNLGFGGPSKVMTDKNGRKFIKYRANGVITPNIYLGETTPREIAEQLLLYGNENELNLPDQIVDKFKKEQADARSAREELDRSEIASIKDWLKSEGIPFSDVIDSERGYRIAYTDRRSDGGWPMDYIEVRDLSDAKERVDEIRDRVRQAAHPDDVPPSQRKELPKSAPASAPSAEGTTTPPKSADAPQVVKTTRDGESVRIVENGREYEVELPDVKFPKTFTKATSKADWEAKMAEVKKIADELKKKAPFHSVINPKTGKYYTNGSEVARQRRREVAAYEEAVRRAADQAFDEIGEYDDSWDEAPASAPQGGKSGDTAEQTPVQKKYAELLAALADAGAKQDAALKAQDQIGVSEGLIARYKAELAVRDFEKKHKGEKIETDGVEYPARDFSSLTDNGIRQRIKDAQLSVEQQKAENAAHVRESRTAENQDNASDIDEVRAAFEREHRVKFGADGNTEWTFPEKGVAERYRVLDGPWGASVETERVDLKSVKADIKSAIGSNSAYRDEVAERTKAFLESGGDVDALAKWKDAPDVAEDIVIRAAEKMGVGLTRGDARLPKQMDEILSELKSIVSRRTTEKSSQVATPRTPSIVMPNAAAAKEVRDALDAIDFDTTELGAREKQGALSGGTSRNQNPSGNEYGKKWKIFRPNTRNADIGAGRFDKATQFLAELGVENIPFDPVNRDSETNQRSAEAVRANPTDTATVHNVLNMIDNDSVLENIVNQAARAIRKSGTAIFTIYEGNRTGKGTATRDGYQRNMKAADYVPYLKKYFGHVETHGNVILAKQPKDVGSAFWAFDSTFDVGVSFDTKTLGGGTFDPEKFGRLVTGVGNLVDKLTKYGYKDFKSLATYIYEQDAAKYGRAKPVLQDVWNAVARARGLARVSDAQADEVYGIIEAKAKEVENGADGNNGGAGGVRTAAGAGEQPGGVLAGGRVREQNPDGRVDGERPGGVPGLGEGVAGAEAAGGGQEAGGGASEGAGAVADSARPGGGERADGRDSAGNGNQAGTPRVKKPAEKAADDTKVNPPPRDFVMTKAVEDAILTKNTTARIKNNLDAIRLIRALKARGYAATPEEQAVLAQFVGWGGLREKVFSYDLERAYDAERSGDASMAKEILRRRNISQNLYDLHKELRSVLNEKEYESAKKSSSTAFYTPVEFVRILHSALRDLGVKGGRFLGPSAGTGNFASAAGQYEKPVNWQFVEKDTMTGELLKALFPNQRVTIGGFEETKFPDGFFDFAIDNVPYADVPINDRSLSSRMFKIHDYFFAKTLAKLRPGGVMAFLTSTGTLDKTSPILRQYLTEHGGKIVGAVRLPNGFFSENAGTEAASDLVIVQKVDGRPDNSAFEKGVEYGTTTEWVPRKGQVKKPLYYNGYFNEHPEQVVGTLEVTNGQYGPTLKYTMPDGGTLWDKVREAVKNALAGVDSSAMLKSATVAEPKERTPIYDEEGLRQGNVTIKDGKPFIKSGEMLEPISFPNDRALKKELAKRFRNPKQIMEGLIGLRKAMRDVIDAQMAESDTVEADLAPLLAKLNEVYDAFVKKNGSLHDKWVSPFVLLDKADGNRLLALERTVKDADGKPKIVKSDIFTKRVISRGQRATKAETPKDALVISYSETGGLNVPRIAELLGVNEETAISKLKEGGDAFENPQTGRLEPSWEYLSGRVRAKLAAARAAVEVGAEAYRANVEALEKVQPQMVKLEDTEIKFGATWVDTDCMVDFLRDALGSENMQISLEKNEVTGEWSVKMGRAVNDRPWGDTSWPVYTFVERVLNHGSMNHYEKDRDGKRWLNERQTEANKLAAEKLHQAFAQFIMSSDKWAGPMYERYNAVMTDMVGVKLPNNILPFRASGMSESALGKLFENGDPNTPKKGREYQSAVIARGVLGGSSLCLAHCVGAGKTLEMQSIGVLGRHLGLFKKPMYVVPNHMMEQFTNEFMDAFPNANIIKMSEDDVKPENRRAFFAQVANGDWDAIIVKRSTFSKKLAMSTEYQKQYLQAQIDDMAMAIEAMRGGDNKISVDQMNKILDKLKAKLENLINAENHDSEIVPFEELGVDQLFVDEAHNFKGLPIVTSQGRTGGLSQGDSQQAIDMQMKTEYVQSLHGGNRGVVFATGTPLSNAPVVESYVILKYLAPNRLKEQGLERFDDFVGAFGRITNEVEFSLDGKSMKEKDKVSAFVNIPELMQLFKSVVDIVNPDQLDVPRPKPKYHFVDVDMSPVQAQIMEMVAEWSAMPPSREDRNRYLALTRIAKNACTTPRLLGFEDGGNKIIRAVAEIKKMYDDTAADRGAQLVFTDMFNRSEKTGNDAFSRLNYLGFREGNPAPAMMPANQAYNLNEEIRDLLIQAGVPKEEIAIIQDIDKSKGDKDANKAALFAKVRSGEVRILIGSRPKMGEGTNVQERLAAIHLLHPGWKPAEDEQAIGRIIRFGNTYKEGQIFYYLTKGNDKIGSYETKNHQLVGVKGKLIDQVMHGDTTIRSIEMDEGAMDRDVLMGLASGNKKLMELIDVNKRVHKLELNTESMAWAARRNKYNAEASERELERAKSDFEKTRKGIDSWNEANKDRPFTIATPDGRTIEKVGEMAQYVSAQVSKQLVKDSFDRDETLQLGDINGIPVIATFDPYGDQEVKIAVPSLGIERKINYSGFIPDFSTGAMTAFKNTILELTSPEYSQAFDAKIVDWQRQAKKMSADADKLQKDYETMNKELVQLRRRQAELERAVTPLIVQTVNDKSVAMYGNWFIEKAGGMYDAIRERDGKELRAATVKELIPMMDAEDFSRPSMAATKTYELLKKASKEKTEKGIQNIPVQEVNFDTPEISPAEDTAYMDAVKRGDMETAARMVREVAARAGYGRVAYHGTPFGGWNQYDFSRGGMESGNGRGVISLTSDRSEAEAYSKSDSAADVSDIMFRVNNVLARIPDEAWSATTDIGMDGERFTFDSAAFSDYADGFTNMPDEAGFDSPAEYRKAAQDAEREGYLSAMSSVLSDMKGAMPEQGAIIDEAAKTLDDASSQNPEVKSLYVRIANAFEADATPQTYGRVAAGAEQAIREGKNDGAIIRLEDGTLRYFVKDSSQIKSADPVTRDNAGNVIPLSQRFSRQSDDIRFDTPELSAPEMNRIAKKYGTTDEYVRGWILPDGRNVDLNPTAEGAWQDHDEIRSLLDRRRGVGRSSVTLDANGREEAMRAGAIRYHNLGDEAIIDVWRKPSARQISALYDYVEKGEFDPGAKVTLSFSPGEFVTYDSVDEMRKRLVNDIRRHYSEVNFDTKNISQADVLTPAEAEYAASEDKTPTEKVMREVYGMTNDEIATALRAAGMEPPPHVRKSDEVKWQQAEALLSNPTYMAKLSRAVAKFPRPLRDYEIDALNVLFRERQNAVNAAQGEVDDWKQTLDSIADGEVGAAEKKEDARKNLAEAQSGLARAKALMLETGKAKIGGASEQGRGLRANRGSLYQDDLTYAGITGEIARIVGGAERVTPEMDAQIRDLAKLFEDLDEQCLRIATERLKPLAKKVIDQTKNGLKARKVTERKAGDEAKRVTRNYEDALNQIEVGAAEVGGTLIGLSDQQYPSWGRWLKAIGEFHCFQNPDITEEEVINAILEDISPFMDGVDANQVRDALTGFGHNFKQSRYDSQRLMNDLKAQARMKRQLDWMNENNTMPPLTGMVRDEPSDVTRNLQKQVAERKKEVPDAGRDERRLKGVLDSAKTRVRNRIADLQRAIETGERIPASQRKVVEDLELRELKRQKEELQKAYDELFKTERTMTDAQRIALTEKLLAKELERALEDLDRARAGDFSKRPKRPGVESPTIDVLRDRIAQTREQIRDLKKAKYEFGMTPEEIAALNARKMANREKAVARIAERVATGDIRPQKKPQPPMTPDQQKRYDELGEQMKRGRQKLAELRLEAENSTVPTFWRKAGNFLRFVTTAQRALRATMDFSAVLRQAARMTLAHPVKAARAFGKAWTAARSEASLQDVNEEILSDPTVREAVDKYGLHLREVDATSARDVEMFHGMERNRIKLFGKEFAITDIPFFGEFMLKSERHYLTYLNAMSAEIYSSIVNDARRFPGGATPWQKKMVADMINVWNGSAALSKERRQALQKAWVNDIFWAPQLAISRVQSAVGYDWWHPLVAKGLKNADGGYDKPTNAERKAAAKVGLSEHLKSTIAMLALGGLLKWMFSDDDDKFNFSQADWFEKLMMLVSPKIGNTTIDLTGGESTFDKLVHQVATKSKRTGTGRLQKFGEYNAPSVMGVVGRYLQGKLSPSVSTVTALWEGKDYVGDEYGVGKMTHEMLIPLTFEDVKDQIVQNGVGKSLVTVPLTLLGAGGSTYDRKPYENAVNRFLEEKRAYDAISKDAELTQPERKELLDGMKSESPLMADSVRGDIDARIKVVKRLERKAKDIEKRGGTPTASLTNEIERQKSILLDKIRRSRRK